MISHASKCQNMVELAASDQFDVTHCKFNTVGLYQHNKDLLIHLCMSASKQVSSSVYLFRYFSLFLHMQAHVLSRYAVIGGCAVPSFCLQQSASSLPLLRLFVSSSLYSSFLSFFFFFWRDEALVTDEWEKKTVKPDPCYAFIIVSGYKLVQGDSDAMEQKDPLPFDC